MCLPVLCVVATVACGPTYDVVVRNGDVIDGTGSPPRRADLAVRDGRIVAIGNVSGRAREEIDASRRVVAPGFIDVQGQSGVTLLADGNGESHIRQGITTEIIGEANTPGLWTPEALASWRAAQHYDWIGFGGYLDTVQTRGSAVNLGS